MKIDLYPCFNYLTKFNNIYLYSDPHFNDPEASQFRFDYIGDEEQVKRINAKVGKKDVIIFLGDIGDVNYIKQVRGYKILIMGNHDQGKSNYLKDDNDKKYLFDEVYDGALMLNDKLLLSHERINLPFVYNIHGHNHYQKDDDDNHLNICAEHIDYTPISLALIVKSGALKNIDSIHRIAIDKAIDRKMERNK